MTQKEELTQKKTQIVVEDGGLEFVTPAGAVLLRLSAVAGGGACLSMAHPDGGDVSLIAAAGLTSLTLRRPGGAEVSLFAGDTGGQVSVNDAQGRWVADIHTTKDGGAFTARTPDGEMAASMSAYPSGGGVSVNAPGGQMLAGISAQPGGGFLNILTPDGRSAAILGVDQGDGGLLMMDRDGRRIFAVPAWKYTAVEDADTEDADKDPPQ